MIEPYLDSAITEVHDDGSRGPHPATHVRNGRDTVQSVILGGRRRLLRLGPFLAVPAAFSQILLHVLGEVPQQGVALLQRSRNVFLGENAQTAFVVPEFDPPADKSINQIIMRHALFRSVATQESSNMVMFPEGHLSGLENEREECHRVRFHAMVKDCLHMKHFV